MTKKQQKAQRRAEWNRAIAEGRVVKFIDVVISPILGRQEHITMRSFTTHAEAVAAVETNNRIASIVDPQLAEL